MRRALACVLLATALTPVAGARAVPVPAGPATMQPPAAARNRAVRYTFPVRPVARVSFAHVHHDYPATDVFAPCGSEYRAVTDGTVSYVSAVDRYRPATDDPARRGGISIAVVGVDGVRYYGSHLRALARHLRKGVHVKRGQLLGRVGDTGDAKGKGCHVHFGISPGRCASATDDWWNRRGVLYPWPYLENWRRGGRLTPGRAVRAWYRRHGCPRHTPGTY